MAGYISVVLTGGYVEAGDGPRLCVRAGDVIIHSAWEAHVDDFARAGATVLNLPLPIGSTDSSVEGPDVRLARVADPDLIARTALRDPSAAATLARESLVCVRAEPGIRSDGGITLADWPDQLAAMLAGGEAAEDAVHLAVDDADRGDLALAEWARRIGIAPQSVSRGFRQCYGVSPKRYRLEQRTRRALARLASWRGSSAALAAEAGFADQAHFTRSVRELTGASPAQLRSRRA